MVEENDMIKEEQQQWGKFHVLTGRVNFRFVKARVNVLRLVASQSQHCKLNWQLMTFWACYQSKSEVRDMGMNVCTGGGRYPWCWFERFPGNVILYRCEIMLKEQDLADQWWWCVLQVAGCRFWRRKDDEIYDTQLSILTPSSLVEKSQRYLLIISTWSSQYVYLS